MPSSYGARSSGGLSPRASPRQSPHYTSHIKHPVYIGKSRNKKRSVSPSTTARAHVAPAEQAPAATQPPPVTNAAPANFNFEVEDDDVGVECAPPSLQDLPMPVVSEEILELEEHARIVAKCRADLQRGNYGRMRTNQQVYYAALKDVLQLEPEEIFDLGTQEEAGLNQSVISLAAYAIFTVLDEQITPNYTCVDLINAMGHNFGMFKNLAKDLNVAAVPETVVEQIKPVLEREDCASANVAQIGKALWSFVRWLQAIVKYHQVVVPKALDDAEYEVDRCKKFLEAKDQESASRVLKRLRDDLIPDLTAL